jgi:CheY-like chemotaxis protein
MKKQNRPLILAIDDDHDTLSLMEHWLAARGYRVFAADSGAKAVEAIRMIEPDLIILDVLMPDLDGYEVCRRLQANPSTAYIPVVFVTALGQKHDMARAFSAGAVDHLVKPIEKATFLEKIETHLETQGRWKTLRDDAAEEKRRWDIQTFQQFKSFLSGQLSPSAKHTAHLDKIRPSAIYELCTSIGIDQEDLAKLVAEFLDLPYLAAIDPDKVRLGVLPAAFCNKNQVIALAGNTDRCVFALSNPFNWELLETLPKLAECNREPQLVVTAPRNIEALLVGQNANIPAKTPVDAIHKSPAPLGPAQPNGVTNLTEPSGPPPDRKAGGEENGAKKILIVDDDQDLVRLLAAKLRRENYEVLIAFDGPQGIAQALKMAPDLILLDIKLPGGGGYTVFDTLKKSAKTSDIPLFFISALPESEVAKKAEELGADDYLAKPFNSQALIQKIQETLGSAS